MAQGELFVLSGPSGAGKGTIVSNLLARESNVWVSVSATTRAPRAGEVEGSSYFFVTHEEFKELIEHDGLLEWANVHGEFYGTPKREVEAHLAAGEHVILEIDPQGALQVKAIEPSAKLIFIMPPSIEELRRRLKGRSTETEEQIEHRCANALGEIDLASEYDFVVLNDDISRATTEVARILESYS